MKSKVLIFGLLIAALVITFVHFRDAGPEGEQSSIAPNKLDGALETPEDVYRHSGDDQRRPTGSTPRKQESRSRSVGSEDAVVQAARRAWNADSALAMWDALDELALERPQYAATKFRELVDFCNPRGIEAQAGPLTPARKQFCAGFKDNALEESSRYRAFLKDHFDEAILERIEPYLQIETEVETALNLVADDERSNVYLELLRDARLPDEIFELKAFNTRFAHQHGHPQWQLGAKAQSSAYPEADLVVAQQVAMTLFSCRRFGGCGANQYYSMVYCIAFLSGNCRLGANLEEMLYQTTPPATFNLALEILQQI